jgi:hypothetical protein
METTAKLKFYFCMMFIGTLLTINYTCDAQNDDLLKNDSVGVVVKISALLDGGVKSIESVGTKDISASGSLGFRYDNEDDYFTFSITALSSFDSINSSNKSDFAKNILNTGLTQGSLSSISIEYYRRFLSIKGYRYYEARKLFLSGKRSIARNDAFKKFLTKNNLDKINWFQKFIGIKAYGALANSKWSYDTLLAATQVSIASIGIGLSYYQQLANTESFDISFSAGIGVTTRYIFNDISQSKFKLARENILGTDKLLYIGPELFAEINVNNIYAKFNLPVFLGKPAISGLTNGQPIFSIGFTADIGSKVTNPYHIGEIGNPTLRLGN